MKKISNKSYQGTLTVIIFFVIFFAGIALKLEKVGQIFSSFNPCPSLLTLGTRRIFSRATGSFVSSATIKAIGVKIESLSNNDGDVYENVS